MSPSLIPLLAIASSAGIGASHHFKNFGSMPVSQMTGAQSQQCSYPDQRRIRKNRRRAHAAGKRHAFA